MERGGTLASPGNEYIYAGSLRVAIIQNGTSTYYWHNDHLSPRVRTDTSGNIADQRGTFPFGETWYSPSGSTYVFTNYYRDVEAEGNDYAQARTYVGGLGRFSSPDPISGSISDPQSLNRYSYVRNQPIMLSDPFGTCPGGVAQNRDSTKSDESKKGGPSDSDSEMGEPQEGIHSRWPYGGCEGFTDTGGGNAGTFSVDGGETFDASSIFGITGAGTFGGTVGGGFTQTWVPDGTVSSDAGTTDYPGYWDFVSIPGSDGEGSVLGPIPITLPQPAKPSDPIWDALSRLASILANDPECLSFLGSAGTPAIDRLTTIMDGYYGQVEMQPKLQNGVVTTTNAVSFGYPGQLVTVNTVGAFYKSQVGNFTLTTDRGRIAGGTPAAQGFILLHELAHNTGAILPDANKQGIVDTNDKNLERNCGKTIKALSH